jgi:hypothetical protein
MAAAPRGEIGAFGGLARRDGTGVFAPRYVAHRWSSSPSAWPGYSTATVTSAVIDAPMIFHGAASFDFPRRRLVPAHRDMSVAMPAAATQVP